jgi:hypothetical protein
MHHNVRVDSQDAHVFFAGVAFRSDGVDQIGTSIRMRQSPIPEVATGIPTPCRCQEIVFFGFSESGVPVIQEASRRLLWGLAKHKAFQLRGGVLTNPLKHEPKCNRTC